MNKTFSIVHCALSFCPFFQIISYAVYILNTLSVIGSFISGRLWWRQSIRNRDFIRNVKHLLRFCVCLLRLEEIDYLLPQTSKHYVILTFDLWVTFPTLCILTALTKFHCFYFIVSLSLYKFPCVMQTNRWPRAS